MEKILLNSKSELSKALDFFGNEYEGRINRVIRSFPCVIIGDYSEDIEEGDVYNFATVIPDDFKQKSEEITRG